MGADIYGKALIMVISVLGQYFVFETEADPTREELKAFFHDLSENDVLEVRLRCPLDGKIEKVYHVTKYFLENAVAFRYYALELNEDVFASASKICPCYAVVPVLNRDGNCVSILKKLPSCYDHSYDCSGELDLTFINRYPYMALFSLNEYSAEIYRKVIPLWSGKEVFLVGEDWMDYMDVFPKISNIQVTLVKNQEELFALLQTSRTIANGQLLSVIERLPENEDLSRIKNGILCYDEIMTLVFMFSHIVHTGEKNPGVKFFRIDGYFRVEGIFAIWNKVFTAARYALAKGYCPIFQIVSSDENLYSDYAGDDIWNKFFLQPGEYELDEVNQSQYLALSPNMNVMNTMRYIMDEVSRGTDLTWPKGRWNQRVKHYIDERKKKFLPYPERTLGILLRGTDYIHNPLPNHPKHAAAETVMEKIDEVREAWDVDWLYLATEDEQICLKMKERYGESLCFTDQERYQVKPGQLLVDLHQEKKEGEGFRLGAEYLCSVYLLARCSSLIASGSCGALSEALRENNGKYKHVFVFEG